MRSVLALLIAAVSLALPAQAQRGPSTLREPQGRPEPSRGATQLRAGGATVTILHFNDVYEITPVEAGKSGGLARVASLAARMKARIPGLITTLGGDFVS